MGLRYEYKYFVPNEKMDVLRRMIVPFMEHDRHCAFRENNQYTVRSIYYDTPGFRCYFDKVDGIKNRHKYRLRGYNLPTADQSSLVFFEIKKKYEIPILKVRSTKTFAEAQNILTENQFVPLSNQQAIHHDDSLQRFMFHYYRQHLRPVILIIYEREAFLGKHDDTIRITFDKNLRSRIYPKVQSLYDDHELRWSLTSQFILEVKFNDHFPAWLKPVIGSLGLVRQSASKYVISIDTHNLIRPQKQTQIHYRK